MSYGRWQRAAQHGDLTAILRLIETYPEDLNRPAVFGSLLQSTYVIHHAVFYKQTHIVRALLHAGAVVNCSNYAGTTPLHFAAIKAVPDVAALLLAANAGVDAEDVRKQTPLHLAAQAPEGISVLKLLIRAGANLNARTIDGKRPLDVALHFATTGGRNRQHAEPIIAALNCATLKALSPEHMLHDNKLVGNLLNQSLRTMLLCAQRRRAPVLPVELWNVILGYVSGIEVLMLAWRLEDGAAREQAARDARVNAARVAAAESMEIYDSLCDLAIQHRKAPETRASAQYSFSLRSSLSEQVLDIEGRISAPWCGTRLISTTANVNVRLHFLAVCCLYIRDFLLCQ